jgi:2-polyprenyl-3-methyl-5-hydroxy-6-metoxy-1,4-benzoquinol methylase
MINTIHAMLNRPEKGYDPVPASHVESYGAGRWATPLDEKMLDQIEQWVGGLKGKTVLDLGGGPGQYTIGFAKRGAKVTWYDVSKRYLDYVANKAIEHKVQIEQGLGYLEEAQRNLGKTFDLVFNRGCWNYGMTDGSIARAIYALAKPGGSVFVETQTTQYRREFTSTPSKIKGWLNDTVNVKIGHPFPATGRVGAMLSRYPHEKILCDYSVRHFDRVMLLKPVTQG